MIRLWIGNISTFQILFTYCILIALKVANYTWCYKLTSNSNWARAIQMHNTTLRQSIAKT
jgi:hypothetical protein